eukprot:2795898-Rhodomonas_salina.2
MVSDSAWYLKTVRQTSAIASLVILASNALRTVTRMIACEQNSWSRPTHGTPGLQSLASQDSEQISLPFVRLRYRVESGPWAGIAFFRREDSLTRRPGDDHEGGAQTCGAEWNSDRVFCARCQPGSVLGRVAGFWTLDPKL